VNKYAAGTTFLIKAGVHRMQSVTPKSGMTFTGEPGTILSGARLLTTFAHQGAYWVAGGQTQQGLRTSSVNAGGPPICQARYPRCNSPEELFIDDIRQREVASLSGLQAGTWYFDYDADKLYIVTDPTGHEVETSVTPRAPQSWDRHRDRFRHGGTAARRHGGAAEPRAPQPAAR